MPKAIYTAMSGAVARVRQLDVASNNLANANTNGFRETRLSFDAALSKQLQPRRGQIDVSMSGRQLPIDTVHAGVGRSTTSNQQGTYVNTGNALDVAIMGQGFLVVGGTDKPVLTRNGQLAVNAQGQLVTGSGDPVLVQGKQGAIGSVRVPPDAQLNISSDGSILISGKRVGRLHVVQVSKPENISHLGNGFYAPAAGDTPQPAAKVEIAQGYLESGNVDPLKALIEVIAAQRGFELAQRVVQVASDLDRKSASTVGQSR